MLNLVTAQHRSSHGVTRRNLLQAGTLVIGGLTLADRLRLQARAAEASEYRATPSKKSVILLWQNGGPSHLETYDLKPNAVSEVRGPFLPIATNVPGIEVCELLPLHAKIADKFTLIRSCSHKFGGHNDGIPVMMSGYPNWDEGKNESVHPELGAVVSRVFGQCHQGLPVACGMGATHYSYVPTTASGYWGSQYRPPTVSEKGMANTTATVDARRLEDRRSLLTGLDNVRRDLDQGGMGSLDEFHRQAFDILSGERAKTAFDLSREDPQTRERYGAGWGQQALLARRLVEAGVSLVTVGVPGGKVIYNWDDHAVNGDLPTAMRERLPGVDQAVTALIEDVYQRGLDQDVLIIVCGEFGRTPRGNTSNGKWGRDHWPSAMSILVSGGGKRMGQVIGATNALGEHPIQRELTPQNFRSMIFHHLGIDYRQTYLDRAGRPIQISYGDHIPELA
ncbi:MAG: hypothetical protein RLY70_295 [Planctomycetota bacterium]|jgi:hypothetical protein